MYTNTDPPPMQRAASLILGTSGALCIAAASYIAYFYLWTHTRHFTNAMGPALYLVLPVALALFLFGAARSSRRSGIALSLLATAISVYGVDMALPLLERFDRTFDHRTRTEVARDFSRKGIDAIPSVFPSALLHTGDGSRSPIEVDGKETVPLGSVSSIRTVECNESGEYLTYDSDEHGFHNPPGQWHVPLDVAAIGDSSALGVCVPSDRSFVGLLRREYGSVLNLGSDGAGPLLELATMREFAKPLQPSVVLWFYTEQNDPSDLNFEENNPLLMRYLEPDFSQELASRQSKIDAALSKYLDAERRRQATNHSSMDDVWDVLSLASLRIRFGLVFSENGGPRDSHKLNAPLFSQILQEARDLAATWNGQLYFVYLPMYNRYADPARIAHRDETELLIRGKDDVLKLARDLDIPTIDVEPVFAAQADPLSLFPFRKDGHYNEAGHRLVADTVIHALKPEGQ